MRDCSTMTRIDPLGAGQSATLNRDGYLLLRGAVPEAWRDRLRAVFDAGVGPEEQWASPRGPGWRHALVDLDPMVQTVCRLRPLLAAVGAMLGGPFFLGQVEGREPLIGGGHQPLHRDGAGIEAASALIFLDTYGTENGPTRLIPRWCDTGEPDEALALTVAGAAGDVLLFDGELLHGGTLNRTGARRRSLLLTLTHERHRAVQDATRAIRNVRMDTSETFMV